MPALQHPIQGERRSRSWGLAPHPPVPKREDEIPAQVQPRPLASGERQARLQEDPQLGLSKLAPPCDLGKPPSAEGRPYRRYPGEWGVAFHRGLSDPPTQAQNTPLPCTLGVGLQLVLKPIVCTSVQGH
ncbi:hypothetical protein P7K49_026517 [Saguinus oedipus]|uniref:Uncharacterized protein n=1 Tax=Saguinus oedipus TaxID=9490 RepID=A0ABQ9UDN2_SAGOE|nr:hypothetical protein P7K49_026517 [Saguinus oedipus]